MGFTFSHPALILPFKYLPRRYYSLSGLVIGSIVPDFEYFIRLSNLSLFSHSLPGLFWFDIPAGILTGIIFHHVIRDTLIDNLPSFLKFRLTVFRQVNWLEYFKKHVFIVIFSIFVGAISHIVWDSFTSFHGYFVKSIPVLRENISFVGGPMAAYKVLKYISSLVGIVILAYCLFRLPENRSVENTGRNKYYWLVFSVFFVPVILLRFMLTDPDELSFNSVIKTSVSGALIALVVTSLFYRKKNKAQPA